MFPSHQRWQHVMLLQLSQSLLALHPTAICTGIHTVTHSQGNCYILSLSLRECNCIHSQMPVFTRTRLLPRIFRGLRSDSTAVSHVCLCPPGGHFQSDWGFQITTATAHWWSSLGTLRAMWLKNHKQRSVTILEKGRHSDTAVTSALVMWQE